MRAPVATSVAVWAVALHLIAVGLMGPFTGLWPPRMEDLTYRVLLETQFLSGMGQLVAVALLLLGFAIWFRSRPAAVGVVALGAVVPALIGMVFVTLGLDYLQMRSMVRPEATGRWDLSVVIPALLGILTAVVLLVMAITANRLRRRELSGRRGSRR